MATTSARVPLLRALVKRGYASASRKPLACASSCIETKVLSNKMVVTAADCNNQGLVKVTVAVKAGSRYEEPDNYGASHLVRSSAGLSTGNATQYAITRHLQQSGATLSATSDRESILYSLDATCDNLDDSLVYLKNAICDQSFRPWELADNLPRLNYELSVIPLEAKLMDRLHTAAYRNGLGNSIFVKKFNIKNMNSETIQHFVSKTFQPSRVSVAGVGVDLGTLTDFAESLDFGSSGSGAVGTSKYRGGEIRKGADSNIVLAAIAGEAKGMNKKDVFTYAVLRWALGGGPNVTHGVGASPLSKALANVEAPTCAQAFSIAHSDSGLFGVVVSSAPETAGNAVESAFKALKAGVSESDVARGKAQLKSAVLLGGDSSELLVKDMAQQALFLGSAKSPDQLIDAIDAVQSSQVNEALKKTLSGELSMASIGRTHNVPYLDDLS